MAHSSPVTDPAHDILRAQRRALDAIFNPRSIALIGASEEPGKVGRTLLEHLLASGRPVYAVNPYTPRVLGHATYPRIGAIGQPVDLAVIATPAATVPQIVAECGAAGVGGAVIISAGFREVGPAGAALEQEVLQAARQSGVRLIGPNSLGVIRPPTGLNASFARAAARSGSVAFLSQSGALGAAVLDWSQNENVGFSAFVSVGSLLDIGWGDLIDYFGDDPHTGSILLYMESVGDARALLSAARAVALAKPIIVLKPGRTPGALRAAASHTGALVGPDEVIDAALRRTGVLRVERIGELFAMAEVLAKQPRPRGPRLTIVTNAGGPGVMAADALLQHGGELAPLSAATLERLNAVLPAPWSHANPIDVLGDARAERYARVFEIALADPDSDGLLAILTPQDMTEPQATAEALAAQARGAKRPVLASWMGGPSIAAGEAILNQANIPTFPYPDMAARLFTYMWHSTRALRALYETPMAVDDPADRAERDAAARLIAAARQAGRAALDEAETRQVLAAYGIASVATRSAADEAAAVAAATELGYPVVLKLRVPAELHKTELDAVRLNLPDAAAVRRAMGELRAVAAARLPDRPFAGVLVQPMLNDGYELLLGSTVDEQFGPVLLFGAGGTLVELLDDRAVGLPPLTTTLARRLIERTRIAAALRGVRGRPPIELARLEELLVRFSQLVAEQPALREIDLNPLLARWTPGADPPLVVLDARLLLHPPTLPDEQLPRPAIRPYPRQYITQLQLRDGTPVTVRPIRPEDEPLLVQFHHTLSERSVFLRYFAPMALDTRIAHERLTRMCFIDYDREMALVAELTAPDGARRIIAVARMIRLRGQPVAEYAGLVSDQYQGHGLGTAMLELLIRIARAEGIRRIVAQVLPENRPMQRVFQKLGFRLKHDWSEGVVHATLDLDDAQQSSGAPL
ncbi:GNAT family N-acetyltransferase [Kallotenue papyrolyticum]|uniref:bifunctional acetate--CoA ligase family protein/GNAT family N-acetyltransferase n=1 Tax=Kallotenue papyrolyticum TaxID=1325125 RepID=UPI0004700D8B|nr:GNAT family N-acetyltransferase [Kallotenue papyrolyticum]